MLLIINLKETTPWLIQTQRIHSLLAVKTGSRDIDRQGNTIMKTLIHFGCSFAMGNAVPEYVTGLESGAYIHSNSENKQAFENKYNLKVGQPISCGMEIADNLGYRHKRVAENGASNEMVFRNLLQTDLHKSFVLIGLTSHKRREALTTKDNKSHWHTCMYDGIFWFCRDTRKMAEPSDRPKYNPKYKTLPFAAWEEYTPAIEEDGQIRTLIQILYMQSYLKSKGVPYLIFNALYNGFDMPLTKECKKLIDMVDQKHFFRLQGTAENTQHGWCLNKKLVVSDLDVHPNIQGQKAWANKLLPQIKEIINEG